MNVSRLRGLADSRPKKDICIRSNFPEISMTTTDNPFSYKIELHVHLDGSVRPETILEIARRRGITLDAVDDLEKLKSQVIMSKPPWSLEELLKKFEIFMPVISGEREAVYQIAYEFCEDCSNQGIKYVEARYSPHLLAKDLPKATDPPKPGSYTPRDVVETVCSAFEKASTDFNIRIKSILCCIMFKPEWSAEVLQLCKDFKSRGVVAIDIACGDLEPGVPITDCFHKKAFKEAYRAGIHRTVHAGEDGPAEGIREALDHMHAERIGHGYKVLDDEKLYLRVKEENVHLEVCPLSSMRTGSVSQDFTKHPIHRFIKDKVNFSINTDDPVVLSNNITEDYNLVLEWGKSHDDIIRSIFNAARSCFASEEEKAEILKELEEVYGDRFN